MLLPPRNAFVYTYQRLVCRTQSGKTRNNTHGFGEKLLTIQALTRHPARNHLPHQQLWNQTCRPPARQGHLAFLLPNNNNVLIVGGTSGGQPVAASELFSAWQGTLAATGANVTARSGATGSAMKQDGLLLAAGGSDASGNALASTELYAFPTVKTDLADYAPGSIVTITGSGWQPGETVTLSFLEPPLIDTPPTMTAVADGNGNIFNDQFSPDLYDINVRFYLTAVGSQSGLQAQNTFTDSITFKSITVGTQSGTATYGTGASPTYTVTAGYKGSGTVQD